MIFSTPNFIKKRHGKIRWPSMSGHRIFPYGKFAVQKAKTPFNHHWLLLERGSFPHFDVWLCARAEHDWQKRAIGFPVRHNASQNKSLQNAFPIYECQMERRYKIQCTPFYYKNWCTGPFFCLNYPRIRGWYQARVHPFSSGNGKGDWFVSLWKYQ